MGGVEFKVSGAVYESYIKLVVSLYRCTCAFVFSVGRGATGLAYWSR